MQFLDNFAKKNFLPFVFNTSEEPVRFMELLKANKLLSEGIAVDGNLLKFRLRLGRTYFLFIILWHIIIIPASLILHQFLIKTDAHLLILVSVLFTAIFFASFGLFKEWLTDLIAVRQTKMAWVKHFPLFSYELHSREVAQIYTDALDNDLPKKEMQLHIINTLADS